MKQPEITSAAGKSIYLATTVILAVSLIAVSLLNGMAWDGAPPEEVTYNKRFAHYTDEDQYARLAEALLRGDASLDLPVPDALAELENPYDFDARYEASNGGANPIFWDHAFYEGKYYCYFGVVPAILFYAPFELATGQWLDTASLVVLLGVAFVGAASLLAYRIVMRYFHSTATLASLTATLLFFFAGSNVVYLVFVARFYSVPILTSLVLTFLGLWFWMGARKRRTGINFPMEPHRRHGHAENGAVGLSLPHLAAGSFCMALNMGCRPQFMLACFLAIPLFWNEISRERLLFSRKGAVATLVSLAPFVAVLTPLLWYNHIRFGSILDFGSNYNLTGFDMTHYDQRIMLTPILLFYYLLQPINPSFSFPFIETTDMPRPVGWAPMEPMFGGYFWLVPMATLIFLLPKAKGELQRRRLWAVCIYAVAFAAFVLLVDTRTAGVTQRYFGDFGWYLMLVAALVMLSIQAQKHAETNLSHHGEAERHVCTTFGARYGKIIGIFIACALVFSFFVGTLSLFSPDRYDSIASMNPVLWETIVGVTH